ncbi:MAG: hypothetical protein NVS2B14_06460 [Chamaesiphon sp.]
MSRRKKDFPCGHKGYGQTCHRCLQEGFAREQKQQQKQAWENTFNQDPIDLRHLPAHVVIRARIIIAGLQTQKNYRDFGGKRLRHNRSIVSIPVTRNYRMLCQDCGNFLLPQEVLSHEDYNVCKPGS